MKSRHLRLVAFCLFLFLPSLPSLSAKIDEFSKHLRKRITPNTKVVVATIYDGETGDITSYGNLLRDKIEASLREAGLDVLPRKDLIVIMGDPSLKDKKLEKLTNADVVIIGVYYLDRYRRTVRLFLKAFDFRKNSFIPIRFKFADILLSESDQRRIKDIIGNVYMYNRNEKDLINTIHPGMHASEVRRILGKPDREVYGGLYSSFSAMKYGDHWIIFEDYLVKCVVSDKKIRFKKVGFSLIPIGCN